MLLIEAVEGAAYWFICGFWGIIGVAAGCEVFDHIWKWCKCRKSK